MVKLVKKVVEVFVDEYTGKEYKTKASAEKAERNSLLYKIVEESRFSSVDEIKDYLLKNEINPKVRFLAKLDWTKILPHNIKLIPEAIAYTDKFFEDKKEKTLIFILDNQEVGRKTVSGFNYTENNKAVEISSEFIDVDKTILVSSTDKGNNIYEYIYQTRQTTPVIDEWIALKAANILEWQEYKDHIKCYKDDIIANIDLTTEEEYNALENAGVDNWSGYDYAIELAENGGKDFSFLDDIDKLIYLENAGVDNWSYYYDALKEARESKFEGLSEKDYLNIWNKLPKQTKLKWENYNLFQDYLYGNKKLP